MKKEIIMLLAVVSSVISCTDTDTAVCLTEESQAQISLSVNTGDNISTKLKYTDDETCESQVNDVQVLVFDEAGRLNAYTSSESLTGISIVTTYGLKTVWAVVNGPDLSAVKTATELSSVAVDLSDNGLMEGEGFVMSGSTTVDVTKADVPAHINVTRLTSRVAVYSISNKLPAAYPEMIIESILLANVVGNQNISGTADMMTWYNKAGRQDGADGYSIIDGIEHLASCPALTWHSPGIRIANGETSEKPYCLYSYPNNADDDVSGWSDPFTERKTKVIITARIAGEKYYYPIGLTSLERNKAYTVNLTITALGSDDPDKKVEKGSVVTNLSVLSWTGGSEYTEII